MTDLSVVVVNWNVAHLLGPCLRSLEASASQTPNLALEIIVVDNASTDGSLSLLAREFPRVKVIAAERNLGYAAGANRGFAASTARHLLLLNPDTEVVGSSLGTLVGYLETHPQVGLVGPRLLNPDGTTQSSRRRFPTLATALVESTVLQPWFAGSRTLRHYYCADRSAAVEQEVDWLVGACLMVRRPVLEQVGPLDETFFLYFEEVDWCRRMRAAGWKIVYLPQAQVIHHAGQSSLQDLPHRHIHFQNSKWKYHRKHHGALAGQGVRAFLYLTYLYQLLQEGAKYTLGHKRALRRQRLSLLYQVVRLGFRG